MDLYHVEFHCPKRKKPQELNRDGTPSTFGTITVEINAVSEDDAIVGAKEFLYETIDANAVVNVSKEPVRISWPSGPDESLTVRPKEGT